MVKPTIWRPSKRIATVLSTITAAVALTAAMIATPAFAGTSVSRTATINPNPAVYEWITTNLYATASGENVYLDIDHVDEAMYVKWVKCGYSATGDASSSVSGKAVYVEKRAYGWVGPIGTNFVNGACVRLWARAAYSLSYRPSYPLVARFAFNP